MKKFNKIYLHIGMEKTGTTSIQRALDIHRETLEANGYYYPKAIAVGRNSLLATMFDNDPESKTSFKGIVKKSGGSLEGFKNEIQRQLVQEYDATPAENLVLSSEHLALDSDFKAIKSYCDELADETIIIVYIREQAALALSLYSTNIKGGGSDFSSIESLKNGVLPNRLNFKFMLQNWQSVFPGPIMVRLFDKSELIDGDAVSDFFHAIGLGDKADALKAPNENKTLSLAGVDLMSAINKAFPNFIDGVRNQARTALIKDFEQFDDAAEYGKLSFSSEQLIQIHKLCSPTNNWVRQNYFPKRKRLFPPAKATASISTSADDSKSLAAQIIAKAYSDLQVKQELLSEIAPKLNQMRKRQEQFSRDIKNMKNPLKIVNQLNELGKNQAELANELHELHQKILKNRER